MWYVMYLTGYNSRLPIVFNITSLPLANHTIGTIPVKRPWKYGLIYNFNVLSPGARPTKHISIEFEIRWKFRTL